MGNQRKTFAEINLDHLSFNIQSLQKNFPTEFLCPMVKANAYGHGDVAVARCLEKNQVRTMGVCLVEEGVALREAGIQSQILVFLGFDLEGARLLIEKKLTPVVSSWKHLEHLVKVAKDPVAVHLKFDTGMNRLGFEVHEAQKLFDYFWNNKQIRIEGLLTHLAQGEDGFRDDGISQDQLLKMKAVTETFKAFKVHAHALNSAGILSTLKVRAEKNTKHILTANTWGLRPGLMLYGYNPIENDFNFSLKPVMTLKSFTETFQQVKKGEGVSYGHRWKAEKDSLIAVVPIGYADGYHRALSNKAEALFMNERVPQVGTICMDFLMLDVTEVAQRNRFQFGEEQEVILFGSSSNGTVVSAAELAKKCNTIPWEILTSVGQRVPRRYIGESVGAS